MRILITFFCLLLAFSGQAQKYPFYQHYELEKSPKPIQRDKTDQLYYYNKYLLTIEYEYDNYKRSYFKYHTEHYRVKLNSDAAIEEFNKVYITMEDVISVKNVAARVIKPNEVLEVDVEMEEFYSEDENEQYRYFPISGLELGDEVEIMYTLKMSPFFNGDQFYFQGEIPIYNFDFKFIVPNDSYFNFLAHNGLPQPVLVDTIIQRHQYDIYLDTIPAFKDEYFTEYSNVTMKLDASLKGVDGGAQSNYSPYDTYVDYANEQFNVENVGKNLKALKALNERLGVRRNNSELDNIRRIENYMKNEFLIGYGVRGASIADMVKSGKGDGTGTLMLFMGLLNQANIRFEYGLISDRYDTYFSSAIESDYFLQNYFIYFPDCDSYLAPLDFGSRVGYLNYDWTPNNGLFLTSKKYPKRSTAYEVRPVKATRSADNVDSTIITVNVTADFMGAEIQIERHITGFDAGEHQIYYQLYDDKRKRITHDELLDVFKDNTSYKMDEILNTSETDAFYKPLIIKGHVTTLHVPLFERAGDKIIFKFGGIFGEYVDPKELEKKKSDFVFAHALTRTKQIIVNFPRNVKVLNTEAIPVFEHLVDLENTSNSSHLTVSEKQLIYKLRDEYKAQRYSINDKEAMIKIFDFHDALTKVNLVIE